VDQTKTLPAAYSDGDLDANNSPNSSLGRHLSTIVAERLSRRATMMGGLKASAMAFVGTSMLTACLDEDMANTNIAAEGDEIATTAGASVLLAGSGSWVQTGGPDVEMVTTDDGTEFIAPAVSEVTELTFQQGSASATAAAGKVTKVKVGPAKLTFSAVDKNLDDIVTVPAGYSVKVMTRLGDPIAAGVPAYANDGTDTGFANRIGDHGDALYFFALGPNGKRNDTYSKRGLLAQNHENLNEQYLHPNGTTNGSTGPRPEEEAIKEIEAHGVSVTEYIDVGTREWEWVQDSAFNRRITPNTPVVFNGPVAGTDLLKTAYSPSGTTGRGTINNCANGVTGWGTLLTCEENWAFYFRRSGDDANRTARELTGLNRYGVRSSTGNYAWSTVTPSNPDDTTFRRWDARAGDTGTATDDYRNEPNQFGWVLEIDPYDPTSTPRKRTALGRMGHEGAWLGKLTQGQKVAVYMGDDSRREYFYKFVSSAAWQSSDGNGTGGLAFGDKYLDSGTLYVAQFHEDGTGSWMPLVFGQVPNRPATSSDAEYVFADQADILTHARLAADAQEATPMDRPEWTACNPQTGEIYLTLTNNNASNRPVDGTDAANPRHYNDPKGSSNQYGNPNGHIIRIRESGDDNSATSFIWDIYLFGADSADAGADVNISGLDDDNDFSSPDGLWFSREHNVAGKVNPLLWIQTDDGAMTDRTNCMMLAALPGFVGDGGDVTITNQGAGGTAQQTTHVGTGASAATLKRFLTGPKECEITGVDTTPDGRTLFVGIQHPGENGNPSNITSNWPQSQGGNASGRPRSAVIAITRDDGGVVGL